MARRETTALIGPLSEYLWSLKDGFELETASFGYDGAPRPADTTVAAVFEPEPSGWIDVETVRSRVREALLDAADDAAFRATLQKSKGSASARSAHEVILIGQVVWNLATPPGDGLLKLPEATADHRIPAHHNRGPDLALMKRDQRFRYEDSNDSRDRGRRCLPEVGGGDSLKENGKKLANRMAEYLEARYAGASARAASGGPTELLARPLALVRARTGDAVQAIEETRAGLTLVDLDDADGSPALLAPDGRIAVARNGDEITVGDVFDESGEVRLSPTRVPLPPASSEVRVLAASKGYHTANLRIIVTDADQTLRLVRGAGWSRPEILDAGSAAEAVIETPDGPLLLDGRERIVTNASRRAVGPFRLKRITGIDSAYSGGVGIAVAWGLDRAGEARLEVRCWDERPGRHESGWVAMSLEGSETAGMVRAGIVRELARSVPPRTIAVQLPTSIALIDVPAAEPSA